MAAQLQTGLTILRRRQVEARVGLKRSSILALVAAGSFPAPIRVSARAVGWIEGEVDAWLRQRVAASRKGAA